MLVSTCIMTAAGGEAGDSPVRDDPVDEKRVEVVVADRTAAAVVLLQPVEHRFGERHDCAREAEQRRYGRAGDVGEIEVANVEEVLNDIECR